MKNLKHVFLLLAVALVGVTSCKKDNTNSAPDLVVTPGDQTTSSGSVIAYTVTSTANITHLTVTEDVPGASTGATVKDTTWGKKPISYTFNYTVPSGITTKTLTFTVTDDNSMTTTKTVKLTVQPSGGVNTYQGVTMGNQHNGTNGSFFESSTGQAVLSSTANNNQAQIDFVNYSGDTHMATLAAPNDNDANTISQLGLSSWSNKNATMFRMVSWNTAAFGAASYSDLQNMYTNSTSSEKSYADQLSAGQYVAFKTHDGKYGVLQITNVSNESSSSSTNGTITFTAKVQK